MGILLQLDFDTRTASSRAQSEVGIDASATSDTCSDIDVRDEQIPLVSAPEGQRAEAPLPQHHSIPIPSPVLVSADPAGSFHRLKGAESQAAATKREDGYRVRFSNQQALVETIAEADIIAGAVDPTNPGVADRSCSADFEPLLKRRIHGSSWELKPEPVRSDSQALSHRPAEHHIPWVNRFPAVRVHNESGSGPSQPFPNASASHRKAEVEEVSDPPLEVRSVRLEWRASRAWSLFQLTQAISHWSAWADEKSARTAVARRHMLRFRTFVPWTEVAWEARQNGKRLVLSRFLMGWEESASQESSKDGLAKKVATQKRARLALGSWATALTTSEKLRSHGSLLHLAKVTIGKWQARRANLEELWQRGKISWNRTLLFSIRPPRVDQSLPRGQEAVRSLRRRISTQEALYLWSLAVKSRLFRKRTQKEMLRNALTQWHGLIQIHFPRHNETFSDRRGTRVSIKRLQDSNHSTAIVRRHLAAKILGTWRRETRAIEAANHDSWSFLGRASVKTAVTIWKTQIDSISEISLWATRANRYFKLTMGLKAARQFARPSWSSTTRRLYTRTRRRQKQLIIRGCLGSWQRESLLGREATHVAHSNKLDLQLRKATDTLEFWRNGCQEILALDWSSHLPSSWLNEWVVSQEGLRLTQDEASDAWKRFLISRIWGRWRSVSVQLHSQVYIVTDLAEKRTRKSARSFLLHWKRSASDDWKASLASSLLATSHVPLRASNAPGSSLWSRTRSGPTAATSLMDIGSRSWHEDTEEPELEEPISDHEEAEDVIHTPTRWTGLGTALARLPTTTPLAPLSTPFERELRGRYNHNGRSSLTTLPEQGSLRGTPRLSVADARRIAEMRRRNLPAADG